MDTESPSAPNNNFMEIQTKKLPKNLLETVIELSVLEMAPFHDSALKELGQNIEMPGFRKGKAPIDMVRKELDEMKILEKAGEIAINQKYPEIIKQKNLNPAGPPQVTIQKLARNNPFVFKLTIPLVPKIELGNYKKIKVKSKKIDIKDSEIEKSLKDLQKSRGQEVLAARPAKLKDKVELDLDLFIDKVPLENGQIKGFSFIMGEDHYLPGLSDNIKGLSAGQEKEFSHKYPDDHYDKNLAGKLVDFKAKIKNVYQINLPEINDSFAQSFGDFKNLEELKNKIKENLQAEEENKESQRLELELLKQLIEKTEFEEIPEILIEHEINKMINELKMSLQGMGQAQTFNFDDYLKSIKKTQEDLKKEFIPKAEQRIKTALCIRQIAQEENIKVEDEDIKKEMDKLSELYKDLPAGQAGQKQILDDLKTENGQIYLENLLTNRKVIDWLKNNLTT